MPVIESNVGRRKSGGRELLRLVAIGTAGVFMLTSAFSASFAGVGTAGGYPEPDDDDDDGLSNAEVALIVVGGAVALGVAAGALGLFGEDDDDDDSAKAKGPVQAARLTPGAAAVEAGTSSVFDLQVRYKGDSAWHSVSRSRAASFTAKGGVVRQDGTKNVFCAPLNAAGQKAVVQATYAAPGQAPVSATAELLVQN